MAVEMSESQYFNYDGRLASFQKSKKRGSTVKGPKALNWPHKSISPESLARAGFFFQPWPDNPDNVVCFLCHKSMDGWEDGDDPLQEHLKHSSGCGWAITAAIEADIEEYSQAHPGISSMVEARKATFAGMWPHDGKRGWKCKTKQLVDAGWKYTPTPDSDDNATCAYCGLGLDGWEPQDKPYEEHQKRSPACPFFILSSQPNPSKKTGRAKAAARGSKSSRVSMQSIPTDAPSVAETLVAADDTVLTTVSAATQGAKTTRGKRAATAKEGKTKAQKEDTAESQDSWPSETHKQSPLPKQPKKTGRAKKRGSEAVDEATMTATSEAPPRKKRATKTGATADSSALDNIENSHATDVRTPEKSVGPRKGRAPAAKASRKVSTTSRASSTGSITTIQALPETFPDDDEIERQLEADLDHFTDDEDIAADSDSERAKAKAKGGVAKHSRDFAMFDPAPVQPDEDDVEDDLDALRKDTQVDKSLPHNQPSGPMLAPESEKLQVPKKERNPGTRKASKQTKSQKTEALGVQSPTEEPGSTVATKPGNPMEDQDTSLGGNNTVRNSDHEHARAQKNAHSKPLEASIVTHTPAEVNPLADDPIELVKSPTRTNWHSSNASGISQNATSSTEVPAGAKPSFKRDRGRPPSEPSLGGIPADPETQLREEAIEADMRAAATGRSESIDEFYEDEPDDLSAAAGSRSMFGEVAHPPSAPGYDASPSASARQAALSPSQSPQSSDAENQPPSSKQSSVTKNHLTLAPMAATPLRGSPSKRNAIAGLQSKIPWNAMDIDAILGTPFAGTSDEKENGPERLLKKGRELTSPEKQMTVEEWIYHNAGLAEEVLRQECEAIIGRLESEGTKAMNVLDGLIVE